MRAKEFITEKMKKGAMAHDSYKTINNMRTYPDQNMSNGKTGLYGHFDYGVTLAPAGAGDTPDGHMPEQNWAKGDPMYIPYHPLERDMLDRAAKHVGDNSKREWGGPSVEPEDTHHHSPVPDWNPHSREKKKVKEAATSGGTSSGSVATNPSASGKKPSQVGSLFGGTYGEDQNKPIIKKKPKLVRRPQ
jgi:hypothetical protein